MKWNKKKVNVITDVTGDPLPAQSAIALDDDLPHRTDQLDRGLETRRTGRPLRLGDQSHLRRPQRLREEHHSPVHNLTGHSNAAQSGLHQQSVLHRPTDHQFHANASADDPRASGAHRRPAVHIQRDRIQQFRTVDPQLGSGQESGGRHGRGDAQGLHRIHSGRSLGEEHRVQGGPRYRPHAGWVDEDQDAHRHQSGPQSQGEVDPAGQDDAVSGEEVPRRRRAQHQLPGAHQLCLLWRNAQRYFHRR